MSDSIRYELPALGEAIAALQARIDAGEEITPADVVEARAADELAALQAESLARVLARTEAERKAARFEELIQEFGDEADEAGDKIVELIEAHEAALEALRAACADWHAMPSRYARSFHELGRDMSMHGGVSVHNWSGQRVRWDGLALDAGRIEVPAVGDGLKRWLHHRRIEAGERG